MFTSIATVLLAVASTVYGHGQLVDPAAEFKPGTTDVTSFCDTMNGPKVLPGDNYNNSPQYNSAAFTAHFKNSSYAILKDLVKANGGTCGACGTSVATATPKAFPSDGTVKWNHGATEGFSPSHTGPCEVWCDTTRVYQNDDCAANIPDGNMPVSPSLCQGASQLTFYRLALHNPDWQIYLACVPLKSSGGTTPSSQPPVSTSARPTPSTPTTSAPRPTPSTSAPSNGGSVPVYGQCGGQGYTGPTNCASGNVCKQYSPYYSQCVPA
ncbi:hypothetical protein LEN26_017196 [Aphanomyces euteiches]|nr:hypothetical protein LEN26_017196 [Aphanomyces euteiches]KAH9125395.1 hypothetical protein AeMF1_003972 [Aphanomyces euteiches]KAH9182694.1 hypothetical protein AeNC1_015330 [Aphanomyces euteiches]